LELQGAWTTGYDGQVVTGVRFTGQVNLKHLNVIFQSCIFEFGPPITETPPTQTDMKPLVKAWNAGTSAQFYDCEFFPSVQSVRSAVGIQGHDYEAYRCKFHGTVDGAMATNQNVKIWQSWIYDLPYYDFDPWQTDGSHNDGIQCQGGGAGFDFSYCLIQMGYKATSGIIVTQDVANVTGLTVHHNWVQSVWDGPQATACAVGLNIAETKSLGAMTNVDITDNRISHHSKFKSNHAALIKSNTYDIATITGNVELLVGPDGRPLVQGSTTPAKITRS